MAGIWVKVDVEAPSEVFDAYQAALVLPSRGTDAVITVLPLQGMRSE